MIKVKISTPLRDWPLLRQTSQSKGIVSNYHFFVDDHIDQEYDFWVVYDDLLTVEEAYCSKGNIILITPEPSSVKKYSRNFIAQFDKIITSQRNIVHHNVHYEQQALPWHVGRIQENHKNINFNLDYDSLKKMEFDNERKLLSVIISNKAFTIGHKNRIKFVEYLLSQNDISLDVYGRGFREIQDKWDAIFNYKYHLVLENYIIDDYWTEKLSDCFLAGAYPFYSGAPNIYKYFSMKSLTLLDINNFSQAKDIILEDMSKNKYEESFLARMNSRDKVLDEYNLFPFIIKQVSHYLHRVSIKEKIKLIPNRSCMSTAEKISLKVTNYLNKYL